MARPYLNRLSRLHSDASGIALVEFAYSLPLMVGLMLGGVELSHYVTTKMRVSQLALHVADHSARIGSGTLLSSKRISETQINDVLTGAGLQARELDLYTNGRVVMSSIELDTANSTNNNKKYKVAWQRCRGSATYQPQYAQAGQANRPGFGPNSTIKAPMDDGATIFVEIYYEYQPIIWSVFNDKTFVEIAAMPVRDRRDLSQIYNIEGASVSTCA